MTCRSSSEWSGMLKWAATGLLVFRVLMSDLWPFILMWRRFAVSLSNISCTGLGRPDSWFCMWMKTLSFVLYLYCESWSFTLSSSCDKSCSGYCYGGCFLFAWVFSSFSIWSARVGPSGCVGAWMQLWVGEGWLFCVCLRRGEHSAVSSKSLLFWRGLGGRWLQVEPIGWIDVVVGVVAVSLFGKSTVPSWAVCQLSRIPHQRSNHSWLPITLNNLYLWCVIYEVFLNTV